MKKAILGTIGALLAFAGGCISLHSHPPAAGEWSAAATQPTAEATKDSPSTRLAHAVETAPAHVVMHYHFPGIGGPSLFDDWWSEALDKGLAHRENCACSLQVVDWFGGRRQIAALQAIKQNRAMAKEMAAQAARRMAEHPNERVLVTAESGGCALAVWMLEDLPADARVESLVLIAPALSRTYDLSLALSHVRGRAYVFTDKNDTVILDWGTHTFGTSDGVHREAAGRRGFIRPWGTAPGAYDKLVTKPYRWEWFFRYGNIGGHATAMSPIFGHDFVAALVAKDFGAP